MRIPLKKSLNVDLPYAGRLHRSPIASDYSSTVRPVAVLLLRFETGPVFPFGFEMGFFAVESEAAKLNDPGKIK